MVLPRPTRFARPIASTHDGVASVAINRARPGGIPEEERVAGEGRQRAGSQPRRPTSLGHLSQKAPGACTRGRDKRRRVKGRGGAEIRKSRNHWKTYLWKVAATTVAQKRPTAHCKEQNKRWLHQQHSRPLFKGHTHTPIYRHARERGAAAAGTLSRLYRTLAARTDVRCTFGITHR